MSMVLQFGLYIYVQTTLGKDFSILHDTGIIYWSQNTLIVKEPLKKFSKVKNRIFYLFFIRFFHLYLKSLKKFKYEKIFIYF